MLVVFSLFALLACSRVEAASRESGIFFQEKSSISTTSRVVIFLAVAGTVVAATAAILVILYLHHKLETSRHKGYDSRRAADYISKIQFLRQADVPYESPAFTFNFKPLAKRPDKIGPDYSPSITTAYVSELVDIFSRDSQHQSRRPLSSAPVLSQVTGATIVESESSSDESNDFALRD